MHTANAPQLPKGFLEYIKQEKIPVLGVCYGMQLLVFVSFFFPQQHARMYRDPNSMQTIHSRRLREGRAVIHFDATLQQWQAPPPPPPGRASPCNCLGQA